MIRRKRASAAAISEIDMMAMLRSTEAITEPISPVSSSKRKLKQAEEINQYINTQVIVPQQQNIQRLQLQQKKIGAQDKEVMSKSKAQRKRAAAYI